MNAWLRLIAAVIISALFIVTELGDIFIKRYDSSPYTLRPPVAKYKIIKGSK